MWFAKWFGGRDNEDCEGDEPARFPVVDIARPLSTPAHVQASAAKAKGKKDFDPYNSGAFERRNAWERVGRR
jgi:hypothetical protein